VRSCYSVAVQSWALDVDRCTLLEGNRTHTALQGNKMCPTSATVGQEYGLRALRWRSWQLQKRRVQRLYVFLGAVCSRESLTRAQVCRGLVLEALHPADSGLHVLVPEGGSGDGLLQAGFGATVHIIERVRTLGGNQEEGRSRQRG